jgi:outer membrane protein assembly factor BamB
MRTPRTSSLALLLLLPLLAACGRDLEESATPSDTGTLPPFEETLDLEAWHLLFTALPSYRTQSHALLETNLAMEERWVHDVDEGGAMGAWRFDDGSTVFGESHFPPNFASAATAIDAQGETLWRHTEIFLLSIGFTHGVVPTPEGDFIALDSIGSRIVSFDVAGTLLWTLDSTDSAMPNGITVRTNDEGRTLLGVAERRKTNMDEIADRLILYELQGREVPPRERWRVQLRTEDGRGLIPHGAHFQEDGTLLVCESAGGQVLAFDEEGDALWRLPGADALVRFAFPRDALFLPDGSLVVVDGEDEAFRIWDPFGAFEIVSAIKIPGVFSVHLVPCGEGGAHPCLGG